MSEELTKEQKIAAVIDGGKIVIIGSGKEETAAILNKLSVADLDKLIASSPLVAEEPTEEEEKKILEVLLEKYPPVVEPKVPTEEEEIKEISRLKEKYPEQFKSDKEEDSRTETEIIIENRRLKQQMVNRNKIIDAAKVIIDECSK